jgi:hypothetical protein
MPPSQVAYIRVTPRPESQLEADESAMVVAYHYEDRDVRVWSACEVCNDEEAEQDEIRLSRLIWERLAPAADWFLCHENGKRIEVGYAVSHQSRVRIRHRDAADPNWWHGAMAKFEAKFTPPPHWIEDEEDDEDADPECESSVKAELRDQVLILRSHGAETKSELVSWNGQTKQMFFNPDHAIEELTSQIKNHWSIPRKVYWLQFNGKHESQVQSWPQESSATIKVKACVLKGSEKNPHGRSSRQ